MITRLILCWWLAMAAALALPAPARAEPLQLPVCIARDAPGVAPRSLLTGAVRADCATPQHRLGRGDYWAVTHLPAAAAALPSSVRVLSLVQDALTLHVVHRDGSVISYPRTSATLSRNIQLGAIVEFPLPTRAAPPIALIWKITGAANVRGILLDQTLVSREAAISANIHLAAIYGGFAGLAFALLTYHLALWSALRHHFQLAYCAMLLVLLGYAATSSGALAWWWPGIDNNDRIRLNYIALGLAVASAVVFARTFFEERVFRGWLARLAMLSAALGGSAGLTFAALSYIDVPLADRLYSLMMLCATAVVVPVLWRAWSHRSNYLWLFAGAWAAPIGFAFARILAALHLLPGGFWLDNSTVLSMAMEALLSSIAISYRIRLLSRERDEALENELVARQLADTDMLTGLPNRRAFLSQAIGRPGQQLLHVIDIDHFKQVNETLGHDGGDQVLRHVGRVLRSVVPAGALVARIGGEEFAIVTSITEPLDPDRLLAKLRSARMPFDVVVTASVGTCTGPLANDVDWKRLYHAADRALFAAKAGGRDRVRSAPALALAA